MHFVYAWHTRSTGALIWEILVGVAYVLVGGYVLSHPLLGMASLTLALAIYLFAEAILEFVLEIRLRPRAGSGSGTSTVSAAAGPFARLRWLSWIRGLPRFSRRRLEFLGC